MTDLEERIRSQFRSMAGRVEVDADSWPDIRQRAARRQRIRHRSWRLALAVGAVVFVVGVAAIRPWGHDASVETGLAWTIDGLQVRDQVEIGAAPASPVIRPRTSLVSDGLSVWYTRIGSRAIGRVDAASATVRSSTETGLPLVNLALTPDHVVAVADGFGDLVWVDRRSDAVTRTPLSDGSPVVATGGIIHVDGAVWVPVNDGRLVRVDVETRTPESIEVGVDLRFVTATPGSVWGVGDDGVVLRLDTARREVTAHADVGPGSHRIDHGDGAVWILDTTKGELIGLSPDLRVQRRTPIGPVPHDLAVGGGAVWVTEQVEGQLVVVDAETGDVSGRLDIGGRPGDVVAGSDEIWVSDADAGTLASVPLR